jgi:hypothetical protein
MLVVYDADSSRTVGVWGSNMISGEKMGLEIWCTLELEHSVLVSGQLKI